MALNSAIRQQLSKIKPFILDNSLRESTVGSIYEHTIQQKHDINEWASRCNIKHQIVASLVSVERVDDYYVQHLIDTKEDIDTKYCFSDIFFDAGDETLDDQLPVGLAKMKKFGMYNPILEVDVACERRSLKTILKQMDYLLKWIEDNLPPPPGDRNTVFVNLRDFPKASMQRPGDLCKFVKHLAKRNPHKRLRPAGLLFEEPSGEFLPVEVGAWTKRVRTVMDRNGWKSQWQKDGMTVDGLFLAHIHKAYGVADAVMLECMLNGSDGTWASIAEEGAVCGHVCSTVMLTNLARFGNKWVLEHFNMDIVAQAARAITKITSGMDVDARQIVYGPRAADTLLASMDMPRFDRNGDGSVDEEDEFALWRLFGMNEQPIRVTGLCPADYLVKRLRQCFGEDEANFTLVVAEKMRTYLLKEHAANRGDEHSSAVGMAMLYHEATGSVTPAMKETLRKDHEMSARREQLLDDAYGYFGKIIAKGTSTGGGSNSDLSDVDLSMFTQEGSTPVRARRVSLWGRVNAVSKQRKKPTLLAVLEEGGVEEGDSADSGTSTREASPSIEAVVEEPVEMEPPALTKGLSSGSLMSMSVEAFFTNYLQIYFETWPKDVITDSFRLECGKVTWSELEFWCVYSLRQHGAEIHTVDDLHRDVLRQLMFTCKLTKHVEEGEGSMTELVRAASTSTKGARALGRSMTRAANAQ